MTKLFYRSLLAALAVGTPAFAEDNGFNDIIVSATRLPDIADTPTSALSVLTSEELEKRQTIFVADALATLPGVVVTQNGAFGGQATIRVRGAANEQTLVMIDGVPVNDASSPGGGVNIGTLDAADIDRIEVLRGPQSTLWGSSAIGGVVNITTKRPGEGVSGTAFAEGGSYSTLRTGGAIGFANGRVDGRLGATLLTTDGISKADKDDGNAEEDGYDSANINGRVGVDVTDTLRLEAFGRYAHSKTDYDGFLSVPPFSFGDTNQASRSKEINGGVSARYKVLDGRFDNVVSFSRGDIERRDRTDEVPSFNADATRDNYRYQGTFKPVDMATIAFGAEREETKIKTASLGFFGSQSGGDSSIDSVFVLGEVKPIDTLTVSGGVRYDDHDQFGSKTTGRVGANWRPVEMLELRGSWGQGFKAPTIYQLVGDNSGFVNPNPDLKPEEADGWDAAATVWALDNTLSLEVGYFDLDTKNLITYGFSGRYENVAKASTKGVEATLSYAVNDTLTLSGNYTYTDAKNAIANTRLIRIPKHAGFAEVDWKATGKLGLTLTARYNGKEGDVDPASFASVKNKSYTRVDLAARYALTDVLEMFGRIENLTDENYQDVAGYGTAGASVYGGVRVRFQ